MNKGTYKQGAHRGRCDGRTPCASWWLRGMGVIAWAVASLWCGHLLTTQTAAAQTPARARPLPGPAAPVTRSRVWPPAVYLGQRFEYRVTLKADAGLTPLQPKSLQFGASRVPRALRMPGPLQLVGKIESQRRQGQLIIKIPLAIFLVKQYGPQKLPPFALPFRTASGRKRLWLPGATFEARARYAATQRFRLRSDPALPFLPKKASREPSHEWRSLPTPPPLPGEKGLPLSWILGGLSVLVAGLLFGVAVWMRRRPSDLEEAPQPIALAKQQLQSLLRTPVTDRESLRQLYTQMLWILRDYLQARLPSPTKHLTAHELCLFFANAEGEQAPPHAPQLQATPPAWFGELQQLLQQSEAICFGPPSPLPQQEQIIPARTQQVMRLLDAVETWQQQRDAEAAQAAAEAREQTSTDDERDGMEIAR